MKKFGFMLFAAVVFVCSACKKEEPQVLTLSRTEYTCDSHGGRVSLSVTHTSDYTLSLEDGASTSWVKAESNGEAKNTILITISPNEGYEERSGRVAVKMGALVEYINLKQSQKNAIVPAGSEYEVDCEEGTLKLKVGSNVLYKMDIDAGWLTHKQTKAYEELELEFAYAANMKAEPRTAVIKFTSGNIQQLVTVTQKGRVKDYAISVLHSSKTFTVPVFDGSILSGTVAWGDGQNGNYVENLSHEYATEGEYTVRMTLKGGVDEQIVTFKNVVGVKKIDLTEM